MPGKTVNNFPAVLPQLDTGMANQIFKDPICSKYFAGIKTKVCICFTQSLPEELQNGLPYIDEIEKNWNN